MNIFSSFRLVLRYILRLSHGSPRVLVLYILSVALSVNYLGISTVMNAIASKPGNADLMTARICLLVSLAVVLFGVANDFYFGREIKKRFEEDVRSRFFASILERLAGLGLTALENTHTQEIISRVKDNFPMIQRVLEAPFVLIPSALGLAVYLLTLASLAPQQFGLVTAYAGLAGVLRLRIIRQINARERDVSPFRREVISLSAQMMVPANLSEINRIGKIDWFCGVFSILTCG